MSFMVIAVAMLAAFCLQFFIQMVQMKSFINFISKLQKKGRVAIGKAKGGFHAGAIVMFAIDQDGVIIDGCFMRGFTMLAPDLKTGISLMELMLERLKKMIVQRSVYP